MFLQLKHQYMNPEDLTSMSKRKNSRNFLDIPQPCGVHEPKGSISYSLHFSDPRLSSTQSLVPSTIDTENNSRRRLLIIYIHGFIGNDQSFHSFPVHVHRYLRESLASTHAIHTKIYPRYKTYRALHLARDDFSQWLALHESPSTDVILVGHSMGGLLAADVVLMVSLHIVLCSPTQLSPIARPQKQQSTDGTYYPRHRILGTVNMDVPFFGVQNSVILTGIMSPFRSKSGARDTSDTLTLHKPVSSISEPRSPDGSSPQSISRHSFSTSSNEYGMKNRSTLDPNYNPHFANDTRIEDRGWWNNVLHFAKKHRQEGLGFIHASFRHWKAHFEFGSCLLDSQQLRSRYKELLKLEYDRSTKHVANTPSSKKAPSCRFVQFYTVCHKDQRRPGSSAMTRSTSATDSIVTRSTTNCSTWHHRTAATEEATPEDGHSCTKEAHQGKELLFCKLARQDDGQVDALWKRVLMATTDEISAHTILFMPGPHYGDLVCSVGETIAQWVAESTV